MSTAFDEETTIEDTCVFNQGSATVFPTDDELLIAAKKEFALALSGDNGWDTGYSTTFIPCKHCAYKMDFRKVLDEGAIEWYRTLSLERAQSMSDYFVLDCIKNGENNGHEARCNPFEGLGRRRDTLVKSHDYECINQRVTGSECYHLVSQKWPLWVVYYIFTEYSGDHLRIPSGAEWCIGAYFTYRSEKKIFGKYYHYTANLRIRCGWKHDSWAEAFRSSMLQGMKTSVDSIKQKVEACFFQECGLDTKVSLSHAT